MAYETLAAYLAERKRGIAHTPEWDEAMVRLRADCDRRATEDAAEAAARVLEDYWATLGIVHGSLSHPADMRRQLAKLLADWLPEALNHG